MYPFLAPIARKLKSGWNPSNPEKSGTPANDKKTKGQPKGHLVNKEPLKKAIEIIEKNVYPKTTVLGEPHLSKRGLYPTLSTKTVKKEFFLSKHLISYCDGQKSVIEIAELLDEPFWELWPIVEKLIAHGLLSVKTS